MANNGRLPAPFVRHWEWQYDGVCRSVDPEVFFPPDSERGPIRQRRELQAKRYCEACPVLNQCRDHALLMHEPYGVWGGLTPRERDHLLAQRITQPSTVLQRSPLTRAAGLGD